MKMRSDIPGWLGPGPEEQEAANDKLIGSETDDDDGYDSWLEDMMPPNHHEPATSEAAKGEGEGKGIAVPPAERIKRVWMDSKGTVPKATAAYFALDTNAPPPALPSLAPWAIPTPRDFDYERHVARDLRQLARRLRARVDGQTAWVRVTPSQNSLRALQEKEEDEAQALQTAVRDLWRAYDVLCFWAALAAERGETRPLVEALDRYEEAEIGMYSDRAREEVRYLRSYNKKKSRAGSFSAWKDVSTAFTKSTTKKQHGEAPNKKKASASASASEKKTADSQPVPGKRPSDPERSTGSAPSQARSGRTVTGVVVKDKLTRDTTSSKKDDDSGAAEENATAKSKASSRPRKNPIEAHNDDKEIKNTLPLALSSLALARPPASHPAHPRHFPNPQSALAYLRARPQPTFEAWSSFLAAQLVWHSDEDDTSSAWHPIGDAFRLFIRALLRQFHHRHHDDDDDDDDGDTLPPRRHHRHRNDDTSRPPRQLRDWVRRVHQLLEERRLRRAADAVLEEVLLVEVVKGEKREEKEKEKERKKGIMTMVMEMENKKGSNKKEKNEEMSG
ncbi:hypothetical protein F4779DRAFT_616889 [Xylariaceae sp. FL0662B]|nr:hypothetical protein F4779DRAFT_616889 [Xylariaceae sp. FL0662B]